MQIITCIVATPAADGWVLRFGYTHWVVGGEAGVCSKARTQTFEGGGTTAYVYTHTSEHTNANKQTTRTGDEDARRPSFGGAVRCGSERTASGRVAADLRRCLAPCLDLVPPSECAAAVCLCQWCALAPMEFTALRLGAICECVWVCVCVRVAAIIRIHTAHAGQIAENLGRRPKCSRSHDKTSRPTSSQNNTLSCRARSVAPKHARRFARARNTPPRNPFCSRTMGKPQRRRKVHYGDTHLARRWRTRSRKRDLDQVSADANITSKGSQKTKQSFFFLLLGHLAATRRSTMT